MAFIVLDLGGSADRQSRAGDAGVGASRSLLVVAVARGGGLRGVSVGMVRETKRPPRVGRSARRGVLVALFDNEGAGGHGSLHHTLTVGLAKHPRNTSSGSWTRSPVMRTRTTADDA